MSTWKSVDRLDNVGKISLLIACNFLNTSVIILFGFVMPGIRYLYIFKIFHLPSAANSSFPPKYTQLIVKVVADTLSVN